MVARRVCESLGVDRCEVGERIPFEVSPEHLNRIEVGGIWGQEISVQLGVALEEPIDDFGSMGQRAVPNDDQRFLKLRGQAPQEPHHPGARKVGVREQGKVKPYPPSLSRDCERRDGRNFLVPSPAMQKDRCLASWSPCPTKQGCHHEAALVDEDDVSIQTAGFFLMRDQSSLIHFCTAFSSRSRARFSGFCGVHPNERSSRGI